MFQDGKIITEYVHKCTCLSTMYGYSTWHTLYPLPVMRMHDQKSITCSREKLISWVQTFITNLPKWLSQTLKRVPVCTSNLISFELALYYHCSCVLQNFECMWDIKGERRDKRISVCTYTHVMSNHSLSYFLQQLAHLLLIVLTRKLFTTGWDDYPRALWGDLRPGSIFRTCAPGLRVHTACGFVVCVIITWLKWLVLAMF